MADTEISSADVQPLRVAVALTWQGGAAWQPLRVAVTLAPFTLPAQTGEDTSGDPAAEDATIIVLARLSDFELDGGGAPEWYAPAHRGNMGTAYATREMIAWGSVLSEARSKKAPADTITDEITGHNIAGTVGDEVQTLTLHIEVTMLQPDDEPATGDIFTREGRVWCITAVDLMSEEEGMKELTISAIRWPKLTRHFVPREFQQPADWAAY